MSHASIWFNFGDFLRSSKSSQDQRDSPALCAGDVRLAAPSCEASERCDQSIGHFAVALAGAHDTSELSVDEAPVVPGPVSK
jgi:hypothetical protein